MHIMMLRKALDLGEHLRHVLGLRHGARPLVVKLVVGIDDQAPDPIPARCTRTAHHCLNNGRLLSCPWTISNTAG